MVKERYKALTRANVLQLGLALFSVGGLGYLIFRFVGLESISAGIASEAILVFITFAWIISYLIRVFTGQMTFDEQRRRYRKVYDNMTTKELQARFDSMTEDEQIRLVKDLEQEKNTLQPPSEV